MNDLKFAFRQLLKNPGFTAVAVLTLALGIGANTAIFSVVNAVLLRPLPYRQSDRIVAIWDGKPASKQGQTLPRRFQSWREHSRSFSELALARTLGYRLTETPGATNGVGCEVTPNLFALLGVSALHGRALTPGDETAGAPQVVLSYNFWQRSFGGEQNLVGRNIRLNGASCTVIGIMPRHFVFPPRVSWGSEGVSRDCDVWVPMVIDSRRLETSARSYLVFGRLRPGVALDQAQSEMSILAFRLTEGNATANDPPSIQIAALPELITREVRPALFVLAGAVAFILIIACANVANLLLARATTRSRELAVRAALGATQGRLVRQILTECTLLGLIGGGIGLGLAYGGLKLLTSVVTVQTPQPVSVDLPVLGFALFLSLVTTLLFGAGAAWQMARGAISETLQEAGRSGAGGVRLGRLRSGLAVSQVALSLMLLISAGLLVRALWSLLHVDPGFRAERVLTMDVRLAGPKYPRDRVAAAYAELLDRLGQLPGVLSAGATQVLPIRSNPIGESFHIRGRPPRSAADLFPAEYSLITPGYFAAMQLPLREGRYLSDTDTETSPAVVVISERLARLHFPGESPIGHQLILGFSATDTAREIVGVVGDVRNWGLAADPTPEIYISFRQSPKPAMTLVIRTGSDPLALASLVRSEVLAFDNELVPERIATMKQVILRSLTNPRLNLVVLGSFAALAVGLAAFGLYGLIAYLVAQRTQEIGIRLALGAQRGDILRLVLRQGITLSGAGIALGLAGALAATRLLRGLLFGINPTDPATFVAIPVLLGIVALIACWLPARRATKVDPIQALRHE